MKVTNTPNVNVTNAPDVKVTNTPKVLNANDLQPFQQTKSATVSSPAAAIQVTFTVPEGKRLVIEFASLRVNAGAGKGVSAAVTTVGADGSLSQHQIVMSRQQTQSNGEIFAGAQQMKMYADPGATVSISAARESFDAGNLEMTGAITGYLVDVQ